MAKKARAAKALKCPAKLKVRRGAKGVCYLVEKVKRDKKAGYITTFVSRSSGVTAFSTSPGHCRLTKDPFQAAIRSRSQAEAAGRQCAPRSAGKVV